MTDVFHRHPEPVPPASQLAVLPFLAAVDGFLRKEAKQPGLRITLHRAMSREGEGYLQQVCGYINDAEELIAMVTDIGKMLGSMIQRPDMPRS